MTSPYACARCRERLPWYAARTLSSAERAEVEEHLAGCAACRREVALWRAIGSALDGMDETAPEPAAREEMTWRGVQSRIAADGWANDAGLRERFLMDDDITPVIVEVPPTQGQRGNARRARRQSLVALVAAALLIALSATLFGVYGLRTRVGGSTTATATATVDGGACAPGQATAHFPAHAGLSDISMVSAKDGWAVGNIRDSSASGAQPRTLMMRYQHCVWSETGKSIPSAELLNVAMTSASDGWAFGLTTAFVAANAAGGPSWVPDQSLLLHYTNGAWQRVQVNDRHDFQGGALRMVSKDDGWLLLAYGSSPQSVLLYHYQGSDWTPVALPSQLRSAGIDAMFANAPNDLWIAGGSGQYSGTALLAHYSAGQWQVWGASIIGDITPTLSAIRAFSPHDVWAFNTHVISQGAHGYSDEPYITHYDGARWTRIPISGLGSPAPNVTLWTATIARPDGSVLAFGHEETPGDANTSPSNPRVLMAVCRVSGCQAQAFPLKQILSVDSLSLYSPTQGFALAEDLSGLPNDSPIIPSVLLSYNAGEWARVLA